MVEIEWANIILPAVIAGIISVVLVGIGRINRTVDGTLTGTIKIERIQEDFEDLKNQMQKSFERLEKVNNKCEEDNKATFERIFEKLEKLNTSITLNGYRIKQLEVTNFKHFKEEQEENGS